MIADPAQSRIDVVSIMTLALILLYGSGVRYVQIPAAGLATAGLVVPRLRTQPAFWFAAAALLGAGVISRWYAVDNHKYLLVYWCVALSATLHAPDPEASLRKSARWLVGLSFLCAVLWKLATPDYLDGSFFEFSLLFDRRFVPLAERLGGVVPVIESFNDAARSALLAFDSRLGGVEVNSTEGVRILAVALTWWGLALETFIALAFLLPGERGIARSRDLLLLLFVVSTYAIASVIGFGWLLVIMGLAQETRRSPWMRWAYLGCFILLQVYRFPWSWAASLLGDPEAY